MKTVLVFVAILGVSLGTKLPSDWKSCKGSNELSKCLGAAIEDTLPKLKNGWPDLSVPPLEPLQIPSATIGEGKGAVNVVQKYTDFKIFGISDAKIPKLDATVEKDGSWTLDIEAYVPEIRLVAQYDFNGRVLLLPIVGNGNCQVTLKKLKAIVKLTSEKIEKKGKSYLKAKNIAVQLYPEKVTYNFENLFNGDERLGTEMNKILNDNGKDVFEDVRSGYEKVLEAVFTDYANKIFTKLPYEEIV